ncbi:hypothetical protein BJF82_12050 [Kytococcus sp. CUA-901]|nr:hypothetical protein BJF82_12050 [Kytococcus sp. CUA-901]
MLIDGVDGTPFVAGTLSYEDGDGPLIQVPYVPGDDQFAVPQSWFDERHPVPAALWFQDPDGAVMLAGVRWRGNRGAGVSVGRLEANLAIFERPRAVADEYRVRTVTSRIDGLHEFAGFESITSDHDRVDGRWRTTVVVHAKDEVTVEHDGVTYTIRVTVPTTSSALEVIARADAVIETTTDDGSTVDEHVAAQWPIRALLTLAFGVPLFWREHMLLDDQFPVWMVSGDARSPAHVPVLLRRTLRDHEQPEVAWRDLAGSMFRLADLGPEGLARWLALYDDKLFRRAVEPMVEVLNGGAGHFVEPRLTLTMFALDALGHYLDEARTPKVPLRDQVLRCLDVPGVDWSAVGTPDQVAQALAHVNNDLKHPDRDHRPDGVEMSLAADLASSSCG